MSKRPQQLKAVAPWFPRFSRPLDLAVDVAPGASLTLDRVTLRQGSASGSGGAIYNRGTLMVSSCTVSAFSGGGIANAGGTVMVSSSTLSGNSVTPDYSFRVLSASVQNVSTPPSR